MARISFDVPDAAMPRVVDALCAKGGWEEHRGVPRPQFAREVVLRFVRDVVRQHEGRQAAQAARAVAEAAAARDVEVT